MSITAKALEIPDVFLVEPESYVDERGSFMEAWNRDDFAAATGCIDQFVQDNQSRSKAGVLRGLHYQSPNPQGKLVRVVTGVAYTVAVDIRRSSTTFGRWVARELSSQNRRQLWIPPGFAHGFLTLADPTDVIYKVTAFYVPGCGRTLIGIDWPLDGDAPLLSPRDGAAPLLADAEVFS
jgi:dTDP-4-dehydrorhamnose 3,5-epimerase